MIRRLGLLFALALGLACTAAQAAPDAAQGDAPAAKRVMMMLKLGAEHYRSGSDYGGAYGDAMGEKSQLREARRIAREHALVVVDSWPMPQIGVNCIILEIRDARSVDAVVAELTKVEGVSWSQPLNEFNTLGGSPPGRSAMPANYNDRLFPAQPAAVRWHLPSLHGVATGRGVSIAIIDSLVDVKHPDLAGQIAGAVDFVPGRPLAERHGTGVAGIIAARPNNAMGIAGVAPGARVTALRACWERSHGGATVCDSLSLARALTYALDHGIGIINLSLTGPRDPLLAQLIALAEKRGVIVVAAIDPANPPASFPAYLPGVIPVADERLSGKVGNAYIAPGLDVPTTEPEGKWDLVSGSSFAAAHVSGLFALLRQLSGRHLSPEVLLGPHGIIDACAAMARVSRLDRSCLLH